jgi:zinc/manganese transport system permease protein
VLLALATVWIAVAVSYLTNLPVGFFVGTLGAVSYGCARIWTSRRRARTVAILTEAPPLAVP